MDLAAGFRPRLVRKMTNVSESGNDGGGVRSENSGSGSAAGSKLEAGRAKAGGSPVDWEDPNIPIGNAPPLPRWRFLVAGLAWLAWVGFLVVMLQPE
ncbi:MAG: hypothetical protein IH897_15620 [Planctomycetes bacterium]|nr:hypothetical protein [Planctomycetota bacterium]